MKDARSVSLLVVGLAVLASPAASSAAQSQEAPKIQIPQPGVPQIMTLEGRYIRVAYNNEGYAILGYRLTNETVGEEWMLLEIGLSLRSGVPDYTLTREAISLDTPDGTKIPMASVAEFQDGNNRALQNRAKISRDSINYFPPDATQACRIGFFADVASPGRSWDQVELSSRRGCVGRVYFHVPGGTKYGQHWLNVKFKETLIRVPFRILTKEEDKLLEKHYDDIARQVQDAFRPKK